MLILYSQGAKEQQGAALAAQGLPGADAAEALVTCCGAVLSASAQISSPLLPFLGKEALSGSALEAPFQEG